MSPKVGMTFLVLLLRPVLYAVVDDRAEGPILLPSDTQLPVHNNASKLLALVMPAQFDFVRVQFESFLLDYARNKVLHFRSALAARQCNLVGEVGVAQVVLPSNTGQAAIHTTE